MKRRLIYVITVLLLSMPVLGVIEPYAKAYANGGNGNFQFYTPNDGNFLKSLKSAIENVNITDSSRSQTAVYVSGGVFGNSTVMMSYNPDETGCAEGEGGPLGISNCDGQFGGANDNLSVYTLEYSCDTQKNGADIKPSSYYYDSSGSGDSNGHYDIKANVAVSLADYHNGGSGGLFDSNGTLQKNVVMHWAGFTGIKYYPDQSNGVATSDPHDVASKDLPSSCRPPYGDGRIYTNSTDTNGNDGYNVNQNIGVISTVPKGASAPVGGNTESGSGASSPACENSGYALSWIMCKVINGLSDGVDWIYGSLIQPLLQTKPIDLTNSSDPSHTYAIWSNFRVYGNIFLIIALLVIVFGESIGGGLIDAYSAKKILPRLLVAAVLINLSIYIVALAVDLTNIIGDGINNLLQAPFKSQINSGNFYVLHMSKGTGAAGSALTIAAVVLAVFKAKVLADGLMYLLVMGLIPAFFIFIAIMATVILRRGLILLLIFLAPVAFALYCLPNTEKYFRQWWDNLFKALLVYPIIAVMFAMGNILSVVVSSSTSGIAGALATLLGVACMLIPLFLIPFSFRLAGGLLGRFHELAKQGSTMAHQGIRGSAQDPDSMRNRAKRRFAMSRNEANLTGKATSARLGSYLRGESLADRRKTLAGVREAGRHKLGQQFAESDQMFQANKNNDQYLVAVADKQYAEEQRLNALRKGDHTEVAAWDQALAGARATPNSQATRMAALQQLATTGFQFDADDGQKAYNQLARRVANAAGVSESELQLDANGNVVGATGTNAGAYANAMNQAQYSLRNAGRSELGGINNGEGYTPNAGLNKVDPYTLATRGKPPAIKAKGQLMRDAVARAEKAAASGNIDGYHEAMQEAEVHRLELASGWESATGGNKEEFFKQMGTASKELRDWGASDSGIKKNQREEFVRGVSTGWHPDDEQRGWRMVETTATQTELAREKARGARRPNAHELEDK